MGRSRSSSAEQENGSYFRHCRRWCLGTCSLPLSSPPESPGTTSLSWWQTSWRKRGRRPQGTAPRTLQEEGPDLDQFRHQISAETKFFCQKKFLLKPKSWFRQNFCAKSLPKTLSQM